MIPENQINLLINHIVDRLTEFLLRDHAMDIASALKIIYDSKVYEQLHDVELELYTQSPSYIYELLKKEMTPNRNFG